MKTEFDYGFDFAVAMQHESGYNQPVNIADMVGSTVDIPPEDYRRMVEDGIKNPNARLYWQGFNAFYKEDKDHE